MSKGSIFLGHRSDLVLGFKKPLSQFKLKKALSNTNNNFELVNNVCPHQGSLILSKTNNTVKCQYHGWEWNDIGDPVSSGSTKICNNFKLSSQPVFEINQLLLTEEIDLSKVSYVDLSHMRLVEERIDRVSSSYANIVDVFLDVDHIPIVHKDVYTDIGITDGAEVHWNYYNWGSIQSVEKNSKYSNEFSQTLLGTNEEKLAAFWITAYPGTMIEWQPGAMFITVCVPDDNFTDVCVFKYRDSRYSETNWIINSSMWETAWQQDKNQATAIVKRSNYHPHLEESKIHFRDWLEGKDL
jgi:phenylpropionate dioxygenase-like ring-hydroxylating dioxygenase large terminal subunit